MNRAEFFKKIIRYTLVIILAAVAFVLGSRSVSANNCSGCPGIGICNGESDCSKFLSENYGRGQK